MIFAVVREQGSGWDASRAMRDQDHWPDHVAYINGVADDGFLILAGPIRESDTTDPTGAVGGNALYRALLIVDAPTEEDVTTRLDDDPWTRFSVLETRTIYRWEVLVGELAPQ